MRGKQVVRWLSLVVLLMIVVSFVPATAQTDSPALPAGVDAVTVDGAKVAPASFDGDVRNLPQAPASPAIYRPLLQGPASTKVASDAAPAEPAAVSGPQATMPAPSLTFAGMSKTDTCTGVTCGAGWPPDPNGDVGTNHYIEAVNDAYAIYNKTGTLLASFTENSLFSSLGGLCSTNNYGDPIVLYDTISDRWILSNLAFATGGTPAVPVTPFYQCIAASKTSDPVSGGWWLYALRMDPGGTGLPAVGTLNDYPKFGVWNDCLYYSANGFTFNADGTSNYTGVEFASISRANLYAGATLTWGLGFITYSAGYGYPFSYIPSNLRAIKTQQLPPTGTPNYYVAESLDYWAWDVRKFTAGTSCGGGGTLSGRTHVGHVSYSDPTDVPQPNTTNTLDTVGDRLMQKVQYRNIGGVESLWVAHNAKTSDTANNAMQWGQINVTGGTINTTIVQQGIHAPDTSLHRWMGSLAVDNQGNMALGYSTSNATAPNYPSIAYAGRLAGDTLGTLAQTEYQMYAGSGSQTNTCGGAACQRWGDYSAMSVDPVDDCTFWYVNEYYSSQANGTAGNWQTRIGTFKFPGCSAPTAVTLGGFAGSSAASRWPLAAVGLLLVGLAGVVLARRR